jgi:DeoR/GlpR family transcriptional regulator of sugar metabolism
MALHVESRLPAKRQDEVYRLLKERRFASIKELADLLGVSEMTIRRDLRFLEQKGLVRRIFGGAQLVEEQVAFEEGYRKRLAQNLKAKEVIARIARQLVSRGDTIALDGSTTSVYFARELKQQRIIVVTNSLLVAETLAGGQARVLLTGGEFRTITQTLVGPLAEECLDNLYFDKVFFSAKGLMPHGFVDSHPEEAGVKRRMLSRAGQRIALLDSTKFGVRALHVLIPLEEVDFLVTERPVPEEYNVLIQQARIALLVGED